MVDINGLDRAEVLRSLYDRARPQGLGFLHFTSEPMTLKEAQGLVEQGNYFDYVNGRVVKVSLPAGATEIDEYLYDRDNGAGAAQKVIDGLKAASA